jgi:hypothetical protein
LTARTRQSVTWSLEEYGSRAIVRRISPGPGVGAGSRLSPARAARRRESSRIEFVGVIIGSFRGADGTACTAARG